MARYIDADKVLQCLPDDLPYKASVKRVLIQAPTADVVEVKHGYWEDLYKGKYDNPLYTCSECYCRALYKPETDELGSRVFKQELSKVCPHCFAKMNGGKTE